ncbi:hypothetical protein C8J56DRAFT_1032373 [Mycena floridula]|nr:hypothetical protein C8J56DRAFT_1032373 [Mycena floridula]
MLQFGPKFDINDLCEVFDKLILASDIRHELFLSNQPPLSSEIPGIQTAIIDTEQELLSLDDQIHFAEQPLLLLRQKRASTQHFLRAKQGILSAQRRIPVELATQIVQHVVGDDYVLDLAPSSHCWSLGCISSVWRAAVIANPSIWSKIGIASAFGALAARGLKTALERSGQVPLSISCSDDSQTLKALTPHSQRWESLVIHQRQSTLFDFTGLHRVRSRLDLLQSFSFEVEPRGAIVSQEEGGDESARVEQEKMSLTAADFGDWLQAAQVLQSISLPCIFRGPVALLLLPWSLLTKLELRHRSVTVNDEYDILSKLPNLVEYFCRYAPKKEYGAIIIDRSPLRLAHLRRMRGISAWALESYLVLPTLENAHVARGAEISLVQAIQRSHCTLSHLVVDVRDERWVFGPFLEICTMLSTLSIYGINGKLAARGITSYIGSHCQMLEHLTMHFWGSSAKNYCILEHILQMASLLPKLRCLTVYFEILDDINDPEWQHYVWYDINELETLPWSEFDGIRAAGVQVVVEARHVTRGGFNKERELEMSYLQAYREVF